jgi:hypothetical protein
MRAWLRCALLLVILEELGNEGADQPGYRYVTSVCDTMRHQRRLAIRRLCQRDRRGDGPKRPDGIGRNAFADGSSGMLVLVGTVSSRRQRPAIGAGACLAECRSQQARTQEHEAGRGQG